MLRLCLTLSSVIEMSLAMNRMMTNSLRNLSDGSCPNKYQLNPLNCNTSSGILINDESEKFLEMFLNFFCDENEVFFEG